MKLLCLRPLCCPLCEVIVSLSFVCTYCVCVLCVVLCVKLLCLRPLCCPLCEVIVSASFVLSCV